MRRSAVSPFLALVVVAFGAVFFAVNSGGSPTFLSPIYLAPIGAPGHEASSRSVCSTNLWIERTTGASSRESWIAVPKGSSLHSEIRSAKQLQFELDPGSGPADACVADELDSRTGMEIVSAVLGACGCKDPPESQVVLFVTYIDLVGGCGKPSGEPRLLRTPSN